MIMELNTPLKNKIFAYFRLFVNCSGLMKSYTLERTKLVLSFLMFNEIMEFPDFLCSF